MSVFQQKVRDFDQKKVRTRFAQFGPNPMVPVHRRDVVRSDDQSVS